MTEPDPATFERAKAAFLHGLLCHREGRFAEAVTHYLASLADVPGRASTLTNLAAARLQLGLPGLALDDAQAALRADPADRHAMLHRATALAELRRVDDALDAFQDLVALDAEQPAAWMCIGNLLMEQGKFAEAAQTFTAAEDRGADPAMARFHRAAARSAAAQTAAGLGVEAAVIGEMPSAPPRAYVESLFERYASDFDHHLVAQLGYDAPRRLVACLEPDRDDHLPGAPNPRRVERALDLGCGTGLCAPLLRPRVQRLVGVDLSAAMLARARALALYDRLDHDDIAAWLETSTERFDLVIAADVFIYVGALDRVFAGVARVLDTGGRFAFTVEAVSGAEAHAAGDRPPGFVLRPSLRYAHALPYVRALGERHAMRMTSCIDGPVRRDRGSDVAGHYVVMQRS